MSLYICEDTENCGYIVDVATKPARCSQCSGPVRMCYKNPYNGLGFGSSGKNNKRKREDDEDPKTPGRPKSAPPTADAKRMRKNEVDGVTYVENLSGSAWKNSTKKIRLAYDLFNPKVEAKGGIIIEPDKQLSQKINGHLQDHLVEVARVMKQKNITSHKATEMTGEAAAAIGIAKSNCFPGYEMISGCHNHSGTGIDQIWAKPKYKKPGEYEAYLIVEAKGPGANARTDKFADACGVQMSKPWVVDRLGKMCNAQDPTAKAAAKSLVRDAGLKLKQKTINSKKYWQIDGKEPKGNAKVEGVVCTAKWRDGKLTQSMSGRQTYFNDK